MTQTGFCNNPAEWRKCQCSKDAPFAERESDSGVQQPASTLFIWRGTGEVRQQLQCTYIVTIFWRFAVNSDAAAAAAISHQNAASKSRPPSISPSIYFARAFPGRGLRTLVVSGFGLLAHQPLYWHAGPLLTAYFSTARSGCRQHRMPTAANDWRKTAVAAWSDDCRTHAGF
jgi:hypothetical protein